MRRPDAVYRLVVAVGSLLLRLLDVRQDVRGVHHVPRTGGAVLAVSHFSYLDFALVEHAVWQHSRRCVRFLATAAAFRHRVAGPFLRSMRHIPVDRSAGASAYRQAQESLREGELVGVFPESRVSRSYELLPLKHGPARMAARTGVPLVPCVVWGSHRVITRARKVRLREARHVPVTVLFGEPIAVPADADPAGVTAQLRTAMEAMLGEAQASYPVDGSGQWWLPARLGGTAPTPEQAAQLDS